MNEAEQEVWTFVHRHLSSVFARDVDGYRATTASDLSLFEWFVAPHRQDGLDFHSFMIEHGWAGTDTAYRFDLLEPRLQLYDDVAIVSYTFMLTVAGNEGISHHTHNESRVLRREGDGWLVVHVHKSPAWRAPRAGPQ